VLASFIIVIREIYDGIMWSEPRNPGRGLSRRMTGVFELLVLMLQVSAVNTVNSITCRESLWVLIVHSGHCWEMLVAIEIFMVIITFNGVLWGIPSCFKKCMYGEYNLELLQPQQMKTKMAINLVASTIQF